MMQEVPEDPTEILTGETQTFFPPEILRQCWFLAGPTASGKSAAALELAELIQAEIVALDSMTIYRGMDIGTAKPSPAEQKRVRHHLLDLVDPHEDYSIAQYLQDADRCCRDVLSRGKVPLFVGGTGLYLRAILRGMSTGPAGDLEFRQRYLVKYQHEPEEVFAELQAVDPAAAKRLHLHDTKRIIRALEVFHLTGKPLSQYQQHPPRPIEQRTPHVYWIDPPRDWLYERINQRVIEMFTRGLATEVEMLRHRPQGLSSTARQGLGYKEVIDYLELPPQQGTLDRRGEMITQLQTRTRQFAKRQHTWFRNMEECIPRAISGTESPLELAKLLITTSEK